MMIAHINWTFAIDVKVIEPQFLAIVGEAKKIITAESAEIDSSVVALINALYSQVLQLEKSFIESIKKEGKGSSLSELAGIISNNFQRIDPVESTLGQLAHSFTTQESALIKTFENGLFDPFREAITKLVKAAKTKPALTENWERNKNDLRKLLLAVVNRLRERADNVLLKYSGPIHDITTVVTTEVSETSGCASKPSCLLSERGVSFLNFYFQSIY